MTTLGLQIRQWRALIWVATVGLGAFAGWTLWTVVKNHRAKVYEPRNLEFFAELIGAAKGSIDQTEVRTSPFDPWFAKLKSCPINGFVPEKPKVVEPVAPVAAVPTEKPLSDVIKVTALTAAPEDAGRVVVRYKDDAIKAHRDETVLEVGALLAAPYNDEPYNARLKQILPDAAVFEWFGKDVQVRPARLEEKGTAAAGTAKPADAAVDASLTAAEAELLALNKDSKKTVKLPDDAGFVIGRDDYAELSNNADAYLRDAKLTEQKDANGKKEVVVGQIRPRHHLASTYDIQTGDTLVSINGKAISTRAEAYQYVRENQELSKYVVVIRRKGREITKTILVNRSKGSP